MKELVGTYFGLLNLFKSVEFNLFGWVILTAYIYAIAFISRMIPEICSHNFVEECNIFGGNVIFHLSD